jgi:hypothetical protein
MSTFCKLECIFYARVVYHCSMHVHVLYVLVHVICISTFCMYECMLYASVHVIFKFI